MREPRRTFRERRTSILIALGLMAAVIVVAFTQEGSTNGTRLDPANPGIDGAQAVAEVLGDEGVEVDVVRSAAGLTNADVGTEAMVVVTSPENLGTSTVRSLFADTDGAEVIVVDAGPSAVRAFEGVSTPSSEDLSQGRSGACELAALSGLTLEVDTGLSYPGTDGCFTEDGRSVLLRSGDGLFFGAGEALTNDQILRGDNAAIALRALGQRERLVWYVPDLADTNPSESASLSRLIPRWIAPALWLAALTMIALILWRGRRLGPLATEPLPVSVKAIETTASRGRLYRRAGDRGHAAAALRAAARSGSARRLRLGRGADEDALIRALAVRLGRPESEVAALIGSSAAVPSNDHDLITLANDLAELDREVHHP